MSKYENDILHERESQWGDPYTMHSKIAKIWSGIFGIDIEPWQVALAMVGMKAARASHNPTDLDSVVDMKGYLEIFELLVEKE